MEHADRDNDGNGWAQAEAETLRGSISQIWLIPFSFFSLLILQDNRWLWANNAANLSALYTQVTLSYTDPVHSGWATVGHINIWMRTAQGWRHKYHNSRSGYIINTWLIKAIICMITFTKLNQTSIKKYITYCVCIKQKNSNSILERVHDLDRNS